MNYVNHNGNLLPDNEPVLSIDNRGFKYGDALFETIRIFNGKACFLDSHLKRLLSGMELLQMEVPKTLTTSFLNKEINKLVVKNSIGKSGRVRFNIYRNSGGLYAPENNTVSFLIEANSIPEDEFELNKVGLTIDLYEDQKKNINRLAALKSNNCLNYVLAGQYKIQHKLDECVLLNDLGSISECVSSNIFVIFNGVFYTPSTNQGIVPGVMREQMIALARENKIEVQECPLSPQVLLKADEVMLTNAIHGIKWVGAYRKKRYFNKVAKVMVAKMNKRVVSSMLDFQEN